MSANIFGGFSCQKPISLSLVREGTSNRLSVDLICLWSFIGGVDTARLHCSMSCTVRNGKKTGGIPLSTVLIIVHRGPWWLIGSQSRSWRTELPNVSKVRLIYS